MRLSVAASPPTQRSRAPTSIPPSQNKNFLRNRATLFTQLRSAARRSDVRRATELMDQILEKKLSPNIYAFNDMLLACAKAGQVTKAFKIYNRIKKHALKPNQETFNYLINACAEANGEGQFLERALWLKDHEMPKFNIQLRRTTYNVLLKCVAKHAKQLDLFHSVLAEMKERSMDPDLATYTTVISALGAHGDALGAQRVYEEMKENKIEPDLRLYNTMLQALSKGANSRALEGFFKDMRAHGFAPDVRTFSIMLRDAYEREDYDLAVTFLAEIKRENIVPDVELCNALIRVGARSDSGRMVVSDVIALMRKYRLEANADTHQTLIAAYALLKEPKLALSTFEDMKQRGFRPTQKAYTSLLVACRESGDAERAMAIYRLVESSGTTPDEVFLRVLNQTLSPRPDLLRQVKRPPSEQRQQGAPRRERTLERREPASEGPRERSGAAELRQMQTRAKDEAAKATKKATAKPATTARKEKSKEDQEKKDDRVAKEKSEAAEAAPKPAPPRPMAPLRRRWTEEEKRAQKEMPKKRRSEISRRAADVDEFDRWKSGQSS